MFYTYVLRSIECPEKHYTGHTADLKTLAWNLERYLKSGSGRAFAKRPFTPSPKSKSCCYRFMPDGGIGTRVAVAHFPLPVLFPM